MYVRKLLAIVALVLAAVALEAAILYRFVAAPAVSALRAARPEGQMAQKVAAPLPDGTGKNEVTAPESPSRRTRGGREAQETRPPSE